MATLRLITEQEFRTSRYAQVADQIEGRISDVIAQAENHIERTLDRSLKVQSYTELFAAPGQTLFLRERPVVSLTTVRRRSSYTASWETLSLATVRLNDRAGYVSALKDGLFRQHEIEVTYTAGFTSIPEDIKGAVILQTVILAFQDLEVYGAGDSKNPGILYLQGQVNGLLRPYRYTRSTVGR